jgi:hypothetical protein
MSPRTWATGAVVGQSAIDVSYTIVEARVDRLLERLTPDGGRGE